MLSMSQNSGVAVMDTLRRQPDMLQEGRTLAVCCRWAAPQLDLRVDASSLLLGSTP